MCVYSFLYLHTSKKLLKRLLKKIYNVSVNTILSSSSSSAYLFVQDVWVEHEWGKKNKRINFLIKKWNHAFYYYIFIVAFCFERK